MKRSTSLLGAGLLAMTFGAFAEGEDRAVSPLQKGWYMAPLASYVMVDDDRWQTDDGYAGILAAGYRWGELAVELTAGYGLYGADLGEDDTKVQTLGLNALLFPFSFAPNLYAIAGGGYLGADDYAVGLVDPNGPLLPPAPYVETDDFSAQYIQGGIGHLFKLSFGLYDMAIRAEALARHTDESERRFDDYVFNLGLQLPLSKNTPPPPPPPPAVVEAPKACSDGQDNDGDGAIDFPNDAGCLSADDNDESNPQCSDGIDNDGDGLVDFPADKGCTDPQDIDEVDPCKKPGIGERINLSGCGTGDVIVLRGVNFEFDKSRLSTNAQTILDNVADELKAYPGIEVEIGGHTDSKGTDEYNQALSERRANVVKDYLVDAGIDESRMTAVGYGESQPIADNETDEGRELNRRTELKITNGNTLSTTPAAEPAATEPAVSEPAAPAAESMPAAEPAPADAAEPATFAEPAPAEPAAPAAEPAAEPAAAPSDDPFAVPATP